MINMEKTKKYAEAIELYGICCHNRMLNTCFNTAENPCPLYFKRPDSDTRCIVFGWECAKDYLDNLCA